MKKIDIQCLCDWMQTHEIICCIEHHIGAVSDLAKVEFQQITCLRSETRHSKG